MKKSDIREIERINRSIPKDLIAKLEVEVDTTPEMKSAFERASKDKTISADLRRKAKLIIDSGFWSKRHKVVDSEVEKQINEYLDVEIAKSRKLGLLSKSAKLPKLVKKAKQHGNRSRSSADSKQQEGKRDTVSRNSSPKSKGKGEIERQGIKSKNATGN